MCPFIGEEDEELTTRPKFDALKARFFTDEKKVFIVGGIASVVVFFTILGVMYMNSKPVNLDELPIIHADNSPVKVKALKNNSVKHQDKIVYDNISGDSHVVVEKVAPEPEEVLSIPEVEVEEALSQEEKKSIINAFDELAPEKEYKINYVKTKNPKKSACTMQTRENYAAAEDYEALPPIKRVEERSLRSATKSRQKSKKKLKSIINQAESTENYADLPRAQGSVMVQIASLPSKSAAESEYNRISKRNRFLSRYKKKIYRVDLGRKKGIRYRIHIGPFKNKNEARKIISALRENGCSAYISN